MWMGRGIGIPPIPILETSNSVLPNLTVFILFSSSIQYLDCLPTSSVSLSQHVGVGTHGPSTAHAWGQDSG